MRRSSLLWRLTLMERGRRSSGVAVAAATTWNPADKAAAITLSLDNLTWTVASSTSALVRSVAAIVVNQKLYFEIVSTNNVNGNWMGIADSSASLTSTQGGAGTSPSHAAVMQDNDIFFDADSVDHGLGPLGGAWATGDNLSFAFNSQTLKLWVRKNGGSWNPGVGGAQDPAAGTGGLTVVIASTPYYVIGGGGDTADSGTAKFASTAWTYSAPTGFTQLAA